MLPREIKPRTVKNRRRRGRDRQRRRERRCPDDDAFWAEDWLHIEQLARRRCLRTDPCDACLWTAAEEFYTSTTDLGQRRGVRQLLSDVQRVSR